jgi:zinc transporter ZupT
MNNIMDMKQKKAAGIFLCILAIVLGYLTIVDFSWKSEGLTTVFLLGYLMAGTPGLFLFLEATDNLPDIFYSREE